MSEHQHAVYYVYEFISVSYRFIILFIVYYHYCLLFTIIIVYCLLSLLFWLLSRRHFSVCGSNKEILVLNIRVSLATYRQSFQLLRHTPLSLSLILLGV